jgi:hypothetical protein
MQKKCLSYAIVLATDLLKRCEVHLEAMTMKLRLPGFVLPIGMILAIGCGARSTLDSPADETTDSTGGSAGSLGKGGQAGTPGTGGQAGTPGTGGQLTIPSVGGSKTGGATGGTGGEPNTGGAGGVYYITGGTGGGYGPGGSPSSGGGKAGSGAGGKAGAGGGYSVVDGGPSGKGGAFSTPDAMIDTRRIDSGPPETGGSFGIDSGTCIGLGSNEEMIDDLNDANASIASINGRVGNWFVGNDGSTGASITSFTPNNSGDACRKYTSYLKGYGFSDWGVDFGFGLGSPYNASDYTGISFWAKVDNGTNTVLRVAFPDKDTYQIGGVCESNVTGPTACYKHFGARITLTTEWKKYTVTFTQISQEGWSVPGTNFDPASLYEVLFQIPVNATFGIWIDDVAFTL